MIALLDGDIIAYRSGFATENEDEALALWQADEMIEGILRDTGCDSYRCFLSDSQANNFRYSVFPDYKANRIGKPRPRHLKALKQHLLKEHNAEIAEGMEADDYLGIYQDKVGEVLIDRPDEFYHEYKTMICSIDKDLKMIPGWHYNFVKKEVSIVSEPEGLRSFYTSILTGDVADNIKGCPGIGIAKASKCLKQASSEAALFDGVYRCFISTLPAHWKKQGYKSTNPKDEIEEILLVTGQLLKIKQEKDEGLWHFPKEPPMMEVG